MAATEPFQLQNPNKTYAAGSLCLGKVNSSQRVWFPLCNTADAHQTVRFLDVPGDPQGRIQVAVGPATDYQCVFAVDTSGGTSDFQAFLGSCSASDPKNLFSFSGGALRTTLTYTVYTPFGSSTKTSTLCLDDGGASATSAGPATFITCSSSSPNQSFAKLGEPSGSAVRSAPESEQRGGTWHTGSCLLCRACPVLTVVKLLSMPRVYQFCPACVSVPDVQPTHAPRLLLPHHPPLHRP